MGNGNNKETYRFWSGRWTPRSNVNDNQDYDRGNWLIADTQYNRSGWQNLNWITIIGWKVFNLTLLNFNLNLFISANIGLWEKAL